MPTTFCVPKNNLTTTLSAAHTSSSGTFVVATGDGAKFGTVDSTHHVRFTVVKASAIDANGAISDPTKLAIFVATAISGDALTVGGAQEGTTDQSFAIGDYVIVEPTAATFADIHAAVNAAETTIATQGTTIAGLPSFGSMAIQSANAVAITGGTSAGVVVASQGGGYRVSVSGAFDLTLSNYHVRTLDGTNGTLSLANELSGESFTIELHQDSTGSRTVTWWSGITWSGGSVPTLVTIANAYDVFSFKRRASGNYLGFYVGSSAVPSTGGAVSSVAGRTGAVVLAESDIPNLSSDLSTLTAGVAARLVTANNLSDVNAGTARTNLGLGTLATQAASAVAITGGTLGGVVVTSHGGSRHVANSGAFDLTVADYHVRTLDGTNGTISLVNILPLQAFTIEFIQDSAGSRVVTWFSGITWAGGSVPTLATAAGAVDIFTFKQTSSGAYLGFYAGSTATASGLGTLASQNANSVAITGGSMGGVTVTSHGGSRHVANSGAFDLTVADYHVRTLDGSNGTLSLTNELAAQNFAVELIQDGTGSRTVTWWAGITWMGGSAPTIATTPGSVSVISFKRRGAGDYLGFYAGSTASLSSVTSVAGRTGAVVLSKSDLSDVATLAPLASPAFTGTPTAPTAAGATNTTQIATTAFVRGEVAALVASAPTSLDTLNELATALGNDSNFAVTVTTSLGGKLAASSNLSDLANAATARTNLGVQPTASPTFTGDATFTGTVSGVTPPTHDNSFLLATTEWVRIQGFLSTAYTPPSGSMGAQSASAVAITGGTIAGVAITGSTIPESNVTGLTADLAGKAPAMIDTAIKTANYTLAANESVSGDTTSGNLVFTLLSSAPIGTYQEVKMVTQGGTNTITVNCAGSDTYNKSGGLTSVVLSLLNQGIVLRKASATVWKVVADDTPLSQLDARYPAITGPILLTGASGGSPAVFRQTGGAAGVKEAQVSHDGTNARITEPGGGGLYVGFGYGGTGKAFRLYRIDVPSRNVEIDPDSGGGGGGTTLTTYGNLILSASNASGDIYLRGRQILLVDPSYNHDAGLTRSATGVVQVTNGSTGPGGFSSVANTPATFSANANNYAPGAGLFHRWSASTTVNVTGMVAGQAGEWRTIVNAGTNAITLTNQDSSSTAANRWLTTTGSSVVLGANQIAYAIYDAITAAWRVSLLP